LARAVRLRAWQLDALDKLGSHREKSFLAVATPGAGKTRFALTAVLRNLAEHPHRHVAVVAPTQHLKVQWADAAAEFGLQLEPEWRVDDGWPTDMHGVVTTYQQVASSPRAFRKPTRDGIVVLDELHHAGTERAWGDSLLEAFEGTELRLCLSGTPFRSDTNAIPFIEYTFEQAVADYTYGYDDALRDGGVVRPVFFPRVGGHMEWLAPDGTEVAASFDDPLDRVGQSQRLRTALSAQGQWLPTVLRQAHERLTELRVTHPDAGGLVIAMDVEHAQACVGLLEALGTRATIATSDDPQASEKIAAFAASRDPWIVAVRMISEGVDIPRLRVGVYATNVVTELFFRQAVGRLVRWTRGMRRQKAFMFLPDDPRLRLLAAGIAEQRTHSLRRRELDGDQDPVALDEAQPDADGQMSMFAMISAVATQEHDPSNVFADSHDEDLIHDDEDDDDPRFMLELPAPPRRGSLGEQGPDGERLAPVPRGKRKKELRQGNADRVKMLVRLTGLEPAEVNARLNSEAGIDRVGEATLGQLDKRLRAADRWLSRV